ncbi:MAG TPA: class I SAM-dependent methyltransferase [Candidatus Limnocylindrales bacterium]|nr:class I SAM-dependent methyltransferase [Candidatus Limnocylindrales bacterium]
MPEITDPAIERYATEHSSAEPALLAELAAETRDFSRWSGMMVGRLEGRFLKTLVAAVGARHVLEIGTFTGYSALSMAEALPADGRIVTCEIDPRHAELAQRYFDKSPYAAMIELRLGPAIETLEGLEGTFDFVFIDADKPSYGDYYEAILPHLEAGGLICVDNVLWSGDVLNAAATDESTVALRAFNDMVASDPRVECVMLPIRDGVTLIRRI